MPKKAFIYKGGGVGEGEGGKERGICAEGMYFCLFDRLVTLLLAGAAHAGHSVLSTDYYQDIILEQNIMRCVADTQ